MVSNEGHEVAKAAKTRARGKKEKQSKNFSLLHSRIRTVRVRKCHIDGLLQWPRMIILIIPVRRIIQRVLPCPPSLCIPT